MGSNEKSETTLFSKTFQDLNLTGVSRHVHFLKIGKNSVSRQGKCSEMKWDTDPSKSNSRIFTTVFETEFLPISKK